MDKKQLAVRRAIESAIALCDNSQAELARRADVSVQTINNAFRRGSVSPELAEALERAVAQQISRSTFVWGNPDQKAA